MECTLENGMVAQCHQITVGYLPDGLKVGPFRPATLEDAGGIWESTGENAGRYRIDGRLVAVESVSITTERSFNAESFTFEPTRPFTIGLFTRDVIGNDNGLEYIGTRRQ
ncbi:hypothetical protein KUL25_12470 [Rhodobacteraceae bacterium N5(2021)]|uniref:Uncharacterized protein n=1 Tax=Gymnodinialimonas phycosphaerae TaxID=2841589 RepID=A0A975YEE4_9RHOB|nr:hypothetical protein [Gymnodinialimonas phycosphaerae]MBY4893577.1 hypothetical protein [Gymnodinialimonas phycosphaerae]